MAAPIVLPIPIKLDCKNLRVERQRENNKNTWYALITQSQALVKHLCNNKELERVLREPMDLGYDPLSLAQVLQKCSGDHAYALALAGRISKKASRQGIKDEAYILKRCNETVSQVGIWILPQTECRPARDGRILSNKDFKRQSDLKEIDCLKSFDATIGGQVSGWVFAKVVFGAGGHQDNVFEEAREFGEWVIKYGEADELYVILIDTDLDSKFQRLKERFQLQSNILVCDHFELQQALITRAYIRYMCDIGGCSWILRYWSWM